MKTCAPCTVHYSADPADGCHKVEILTGSSRIARQIRRGSRLNVRGRENDFVQHLTLPDKKVSVKGKDHYWSDSHWCVCVCVCGLQ